MKDVCFALKSSWITTVSRVPVSTYVNIKSVMCCQGQIVLCVISEEWKKKIYEICCTVSPKVSILVSIWKALQCEPGIYLSGTGGQNISRLTKSSHIYSVIRILKCRRMVDLICRNAILILTIFWTDSDFAALIASPVKWLGEHISSPCWVTHVSLDIGFDVMTVLPQ